MTATVFHLFPDDADDATRLADQAIWWGRQVVNARAVLRSPEAHSDDELRDACATLQSRWGDAMDYLNADAMIYTLNQRERMQRHAAAQEAVETSAQIAARYMPRLGEIAAMALGLAAAVAVAMGWAG